MPHDNEQGDDEQDTLARNLESTIGPAARYADHAVGETITYRDGPEIRMGMIIYVSPPSELPGGQHVPLTYTVDSGRGFPDLVYATDIIEPTQEAM